jgi:ferric-dicitrate binding protein FerR (iron transport regulator)
MGAAAAVSAMSQIAALSGQGNEDLIKAAAALQMTAGALEVISALRGVLQLRTAIKAAEAAAHITKWGPAALAVGAAAAGGAAIYALTMEQQEFNFEGDYSTGAGQREMMMQLEGTR